LTSNMHRERLPMLTRQRTRARAVIDWPIKSFLPRLRTQSTFHCADCLQIPAPSADQSVIAPNHPARACFNTVHARPCPPTAGPSPAPAANVSAFRASQRQQNLSFDRIQRTQSKRKNRCGPSSFAPFGKNAAPMWTWHVLLAADGKSDQRRHINPSPGFPILGRGKGATGLANDCVAA